MGCIHLLPLLVFGAIDIITNTVTVSFQSQSDEPIVLNMIVESRFALDLWG